MSTKEGGVTTPPPSNVALPCQELVTLSVHRRPSQVNVTMTESGSSLTTLIASQRAAEISPDFW